MEYGKKISYKEMREIFREHEKTYPSQHLTGHIVFTEGSFLPREYPKDSRTYVVSSDNKAFQPNLGGYSIYGSALDGSDPLVRLENYMADECSTVDRPWHVDYCVIVGPDKEVAK